MLCIGCGRSLAQRRLYRKLFFKKDVFFFMQANRVVKTRKSAFSIDSINASV